VSDFAKLKVAVLGASTNPERFSHRAVEMLQEYGHTPLPVHPSGAPVRGLETKRSLGELGSGVDTLCVYVNKDISTALGPEILGLAPRRVIFNPGTENPALEGKLAAAGIVVERVCTLVLLRTGAF